MLLPRGTSVAEALFAARVDGIDRYSCIMVEVEPTGATLVLLADEAVVAAVAFAAVTPVTTTAVPVAATPPARPLVVLLA